MVAVYEEEQKFGQWWLWSLLATLFFLSAISLSETKEFYLQSASLFVFVITTILIVFFGFMRLYTKISPSEISFKYYPFFKRTYQWVDIDSVELINYGFVGGWGIRLTKKYGTVYNTQGSIGVLVKLKNGKSLLIGTQNRSEMKEYLTQLGKLV